MCFECTFLDDFLSIKYGMVMLIVTQLIAVIMMMMTVIIASIMMIINNNIWSVVLCVRWKWWKSIYRTTVSWYLFYLLIILSHCSDCRYWTFQKLRIWDGNWGCVFIFWCVFSISWYSTVVVSFPWILFQYSSIEITCRPVHAWLKAVQVVCRCKSVMCCTGAGVLLQVHNLTISYIIRQSLSFEQLTVDIL